MLLSECTKWLRIAEIREGNIKLAEFDSETIAAATDQFSFSNVIAYDTFGRTYKVSFSSRCNPSTVFSFH